MKKKVKIVFGFVNFYIINLMLAFYSLANSDGGSDVTDNVFDLSYMVRKPNNDILEPLTNQVRDFSASAYILATTISGSIGLLCLIIAAVRFAMGGNANKTQDAKDRILYAMAGTGLAFSAFAIITLVIGIGRGLEFS